MAPRSAVLDRSDVDRGERVDATVLGVAGSPALAEARRLATTTGMAFVAVEAVTPDVLDRHGPGCVVEIADRVDAGVLVALVGGGTRHRPWGTPRGRAAAWTLVVAGDLPGLTAYVDRLLAPAAVSESFSGTIFHDGGQDHRSLGGGGDRPARTSRVQAGDVRALLQTRADVLATYGHGGDGCSFAGGQTVVCGLRGVRPDDPGPPGRGNLGCHDPDVGCLRGPDPMPIGALSAAHTMQASCNSARLGNGPFTPITNLLLAFLDGHGETFVGTVSGGGRPECCWLYLAAAWEGLPFADIVALCNAFLVSSGVEEPLYVGVGLPHRPLAARRHPPPVVTELHDPGTGPTADFGDRRVGVVECRDPAAVAAAGRGDLVVRTTSDAAGPLLWFADADLDAGAGVARVVVASFPDALGTVGLEFRDRSAVAGELRAALATVDRWIGLHRAVGGPDSRGVTDGRAARDAMSRTAATVLDRLRFDGTAAETADGLVDRATRTADVLCALFLVDVSDALTRSFWLTNALAADYLFDHAAPVRCGVCDGHASLRAFSQAFGTDVRLVTVCLRCGIVEDRRDGSAVRRVRVSAPEHARRGETVVADVRVTCDDDAPVDVVAALSGPGPTRVAPRTLRLDGPQGTRRARVELPLPETLPPTEFRIKTLVADGRDVVFTSRMLFVS